MRGKGFGRSLPLSYKVLFASKRTARRNLILGGMIVIHLTLVISIIYYFLIFGYPLTVEYSSFKGIHDESSSKVKSYVDLEKLVYSRKNQAIFSQVGGSEGSFYDDVNNVVGTIDKPNFNQFQKQPYVSNGYIGARIPYLGQGFSYDQLSDRPGANDDDVLNGFPLFNKRYAGAFVAGFYDVQKNVTETNFPELYERGYESILSSVPQWTSLTLSAKINGKSYSLDPSLTSTSHGEITDYIQSLSLNDGVVSTEFIWLSSIKVKIDVLAHRAFFNLGIVNVRLEDLNNSGLDIRIEDKLDIKSSQRGQLYDNGHDSKGIYMTFQPKEVDYAFGSIYSSLKVSKPLSGSTINRNSKDGLSTQNLTVRLNPSNPIYLTKYAGVMTSDIEPSSLNGSNAVFEQAKMASLSAHRRSDIFALHEEAWANVLGEGPSIDFVGDPLLNLVARASLYHLAANTRPEASGLTSALPVSGLSSDSYGGMVFWDTDLWIMNGVLPYLPSHAKSLVNYRVYTHEQARKNVPQGMHGAVYPWTSGRFGNCTSTGPCQDYEYHINIAVAMSAMNVYLSGIVDDSYLEQVVYPLVNDAALFLSDYVVYDKEKGRYVTYNLTDPDEYANHVDNGAYTNAGISLIMKWASQLSKHLKKEANPKFDEIAGKMFLPNSRNVDNITLEYSGMNSSAEIKQADVIMITYPLENELISEEDAISNVRYYSSNQVNYGPAMTYPIFSIVSSKLLQDGCSSQSYLEKSVKPFIRTPFIQFSEQNNDDYLTNGGTHPAFPFLTAHGGFLQAILQGFTGLRFAYHFNETTNRIERILEVDPIKLGCFKGGIKFNNIKYSNHTLNLELTDDKLKITSVNDSTDRTPIKISVPDRNDASGIYHLDFNGELLIPLYHAGQNVIGSLTECSSANVFNVTEGAMGDVPTAMNDGDNTTCWQSNNYSEPAIVLLDLKDVRNLTSGYINWGEKPPASYSLFYHDIKNESLPTFKEAYEVFANVDFGNNLTEKFSSFKVSNSIFEFQDVFRKALHGKVNISEPYNLSSVADVEIPREQNTTLLQFDSAIESRYILIEFSGMHDTISQVTAQPGAKLYEIVLTS
ncbi:Piso0_004801 [Millerozyma farinosa CBS 7064]|uniref:alpha,alpha-trehalase n=1 Tax=Pichia sorbitophila (strain ATCC MYA-4447 / BCRC 22081 / CBS 7064 / NBRC 10061 / NRRL Y-12695) TaxID=559304 RepID=G8Y3F1_PICSO|nr:Piso0_004801 [Millerozyma farinosa CBS 7064]